MCTRDLTGLVGYWRNVLLHLPFYSEKSLRVYLMKTWKKGGLHGCSISVTVIGANYI